MVHGEERERREEGAPGSLPDNLPTLSGKGRKEGRKKKK